MPDPGKKAELSLHPLAGAVMSAVHSSREVLALTFAAQEPIVSLIDKEFINSLSAFLSANLDQSREISRNTEEDIPARPRLMMDKLAAISAIRPEL
jgi:hypothetical protein